MTFLAPLMLWGSLAASIPIALHFFFRSRYRTVPWAAMKFLLTSIEQTSRRLKFQELLLLLLRVAVLIMLALALARPLSSSVRGAGRGEAVDAVFLFDVSYSMGANDEGKSRIERAQEAARTILEQLPPHSTVQIVACADRAAKLGPLVPSNLEQAKVIIDELKLTSLATDLSDGIAESADILLKRSQATNKELYIFSDMQKSGWEKESAKIKDILDKLKTDADITLVRCGQQDVKLTNVAIIGLKPQTTVPRPGERADFSVIVSNTGREIAKDVQLALLIDGSSANGEIKTIPKLNPGETRVVTMGGKIEKPGHRTITALIKHDDVPGDNRYDYVLHVRDQVNLLVVDGGLENPDDPQNPEKASSFFFMHALRPIKEMEYSKYYLQTTRVTAKTVSASHLNKQDMCVLINVAVPDPKKEQRGGAGRNALTDDFLADLARFVREGHSLWIYAGDRVIPNHYNECLGKQYGLLPMPLKKSKKFDPNKEPVKVNRDTFHLPAYQKFKDDKHYELFSEIKIYQAFDVEEPFVLKTEEKPAKKDIVRDAAAQALKEVKKEYSAEKKSGEKAEELVNVALRYSNGMPAVISRRVGAGEVLFVTTAAEPGPAVFDEQNKDQTVNVSFTWSDWALNPMNMPFVDVTFNHLLNQLDQVHNFKAGDKMVWHPTEKSLKAYTLVHADPDDVGDAKMAGKSEAKRKKTERKQERLGVPALNSSTGRPEVSADDLYVAGIYYVVAATPPKPGEEEEGPEKIDPRKHGSPLAVVADLHESDNLDSLPDESINEMIGFTPNHILAVPGMTLKTESERLNREWTPWLLTLLLFLAIGECLLAYVCGRSW